MYELLKCLSKQRLFVNHTCDLFYAVLEFLLHRLKQRRLQCIKESLIFLKVKSKKKQQDAVFFSR